MELGGGGRLMGRWIESLPTVVTKDPRGHLNNGLEALSRALYWEGRNDVQTLWSASRAAAEVRAWRKTLPKLGDGVDSWEVKHMSDRELLRAAAIRLIHADAGTPGNAGQVHQLLWVETCLRVLGLRLIDRNER